MTSQEGTLPAIRALGQPGDLGWVVLAHGEIYNAEFGWDASFEALVARIVADYAADHDPDREAAWIAERNGERVGCIFCVGGDHAGDAATAHARGGDQALLAQLRILLVDPSARGHGLGTRLVDTALAFARGAGYAKARLWTNDPLVAARRIYLERGFTLVHQQRRHSFGVDLVGQTYELELQQMPASARARERAPA